MPCSCHPLSASWPRVFAFLNALALLAMVAWAAVDPEFGRVVHWQRVQLGLALGHESLPLMRSWSHLGGRMLAFEGIAAVAIVSGLGVAVSLFVGPARSRGLRGWLIALTLVACWLGFAVGRDDLAWWGKQRRLAGRMADFQRTADALRERWPQVDGELPEVGPFNAYPIGQTSTLLMLSRPSDKEGAPWFAAVDRGQGGALRFALSGSERGDWLEWHPTGQPNSFTGGLGDRHELVRSAPLGKGWHLARYRPDYDEAQ